MPSLLLHFYDVHTCKYIQRQTGLIRQYPATVHTDQLRMVGIGVICVFY